MTNTQKNMFDSPINPVPVELADYRKLKLQSLSHQFQRELRRTVDPLLRHRAEELIKELNRLYGISDLVLDEYGNGRSGVDQLDAFEHQILGQVNVVGALKELTSAVQALTVASEADKNEAVSIHSEPPLIRMPEVERQTGLKKSQIYKMIREGNFPTPVKITEHAVAWRQDDLKNWVAGLEPYKPKSSNAELSAGGAA